MNFYFLVIVCLLCGLGFALLAVWLSTTRGNTIAETLEAESHLPAGQALEVAIMNKLKIATFVPVVALFVVAAFAGVFLPAYFLYLSSRAPEFELIGSFDGHPTQLSVREEPNWHRVGDGFEMSVPAYRSVQDVLIDPGDGYGPITLTLEISKTREIAYRMNGIDQHPLSVDEDNVIRMPQLHLAPVPKIIEIVHQNNRGER